MPQYDGVGVRTHNTGVVGSNAERLTISTLCLRREESCVRREKNEKPGSGQKKKRKTKNKMAGLYRR